MGNTSPDKKRGKGESAPSTTGWMTTFSDLCTLLLTFFVLLFSLSSMDDQKLKIAFNNFDGSSGFLSFREYREISRPQDILIEGINEILGEKVVYGKGIERPGVSMDEINLGTLGGFLHIEKSPSGLKLAFGESLLFPAGSAEIREEILPVLQKIARFITISGYLVYIDGHSDNTPIETGIHGSNEELSLARAMSIRNHLVRQEKAPSESIVITGYGDLKPVANNELPEGRGKNRRVEIILKNQKYF